MVRLRELEVLVQQVEKVVDQAKEMELEHLHFLLSMAFMEAQQHRSVVKAPLRLVFSERRQRQPPRHRPSACQD
jgi:hypothetical protein